jgi:hypothetical protein
VTGIMTAYVPHVDYLRGESSFTYEVMERRQLAR